MRDVCVFTSSRADFGLLRPVLELIRGSAELRLRLIASGTHLSSDFGYTKSEICDAGFNIDEEVDIVVPSDTPEATCASMGLALTGIGKALTRLAPDVLLLLGDRYETLCAAAAAQVCRIPVAHIHGGETSQGAFDEAFRHAVSKMSHFHFASCDLHRNRIIQLGEQPDRVFDVGALGVQNARRTELMCRSELVDIVGSVDHPFFLVTFHPATLEPESAVVQVDSLLEALDAFPGHDVLLTRANADTEGREINQRLHAYASLRSDRVVLASSLGVRTYQSAMSHASAVVGNSSSGLLEAPILGVPTVNIGDRQKGRVRTASVIDCAPHTEDIIAALRTACSIDFKASLENMTHPCDRPDTDARIVQYLSGESLDGVLMKSFYDLAHGAKDEREVTNK